MQNLPRTMIIEMDIKKVVKNLFLLFFTVFAYALFSLLLANEAEAVFLTGSHSAGTPGTSVNSSIQIGTYYITGSTIGVNAFVGGDDYPPSVSARVGIGGELGSRTIINVAPPNYQAGHSDSISFIAPAPGNYYVCLNSFLSGLSPTRPNDCTNVTIAPSAISCVGSWTSWSSCSASCGGGTQSRRYNVSVPASGGGAACPFVNGQTEVRPCNTGACATNVNCVGSWSSYGSCSVACGGGNRIRTYTVTTPASGTGAACPFANGQTQSQTCNTGACASPVVIDCGGYWTSYSSCSASCGGGTRSRNFIVTQLPQNGGAACPSSPRTTSCNTGACVPPTDPVINCAGSWSSYGSCSASCGPGNRTRTYTVNTPASGGGASCPQIDGATESISCDAGACANISTTNCSIPTGDSSCSVNVSWNSSFTNNPISVRQDGTQFSTAANSGGTSRNVLFGNSVFSFYDNGSELDSDTASAICAPGTIWVSPICRLDIGPSLTPGSDIKIVISPDQTIFQSGTTVDVFGEVSTAYDLDCELSALAQTQSFSTPTVTTSNPINGQLRNQNTFTLTCNTQPDEAFSDGSTSVSVTRIVEVVPTVQEI